ncbi:response regulator [Pseudorhizobium marinum]|uniref:response regulator n=1 Tax=Pseudorhizobium marinum TaxID=1496690 RepID=UPI0009DE7B6E|nr:response regulator [Pseudorhizobium marinum]
MYGIAHTDVSHTGSSCTLPSFGTPVLVVEDEAIILINISDELTALGFHVYEASNARAAMDQLLLHPDIKVLFTDIDMPGDMDGLLLAKIVRGRWPPIKIIITSGKHCFTSGELPMVGRFIPKPYDPSSVVSAIDELLAA